MKQAQFTWPGYDPNQYSHRLIVAYLTLDIQKSPEGTIELLQKINAIHSGQMTTWERIGNAYCLRLFPDYVEIEEDFSGRPDKFKKIPLNQFEIAVQSWQKYITHQ